MKRRMVASEHIYKGVKIVVATGDITKQGVHAIVNPANSMLVMGGGVAGAIKRAGGREIEDEAVKKAPVPVGKAVATGAGRLSARHVIHAPTMERPAMRIGVKNVELAMRGALECAKRLAILSVAFPGMGTGVGGVSLDEAAAAMVEEARKQIDLGTSLREIVLVGFTTSSAQTFERAVHETFKKYPQ